MLIEYLYTFVLLFQTMESHMIDRFEAENQYESEDMFEDNEEDELELLKALEETGNFEDNPEPEDEVNHLSFFL